jgi:predicted ribosomally synthesized peptide with nif11-like leader
LSAQAAEAFLEHVEGDEEFARELESVGKQEAVLEKVHAAGFDATPEEIRAAFLDRYGAELTAEDLDQIAAGMSSTTIFSYVLVGVMAAAAAA